MTSTENMTNTENPLPIPASRLADAFGSVLDVAHRVTRPVFVDVEHVPAEGPFVLVGNHQLLGMQDLPTLVRELEVRRGVRVRGMADRFHFAIPGWRGGLGPARAAFRA